MNGGTNQKPHLKALRMLVFEVIRELNEGLNLDQRRGEKFKGKGI